MSQIALNSRLRLEMAAEGSHVYPCAEPRQLCAGVARRRHKQGREEKGPHGQDKSQSRVCHRSRASAWAQPWGVTPSESRAPARLLALARRNAIRRARRAGRRGGGHRRSPNIGYRCVPPACPCLPVPPLASLTHLRVVQSTLGQRSRPTRTRTPRPSVIRLSRDPSLWP